LPTSRTRVGRSKVLSLMYCSNLSIWTLLYMYKYLYTETKSLSIMTGFFVLVEPRRIELLTS
jgi:hypothetical protein